MPPRHTPLAILQMKGSKQAKYNRGNEPMAAKGEPDVPEKLTDEELEVYNETVEKLRHTGVLYITDGATIERYAHIRVRYWQTAEFLRINGEVIEKKNAQGEVTEARAYPQVAILDKLAGQLLSIEREFGLTPSSRANVQMEKKQVEDKAKAKFFE